MAKVIMLEYGDKNPDLASFSLESLRVLAIFGAVSADLPTIL
jgi:hypothetical protein